MTTLAPAPRSVGRHRRRLTLVQVCGVVAGPVMAISVAVQATTRDGFRLADHPFSLLALGEHGWIQTATFVLAGVGFVAGGVAAARRRLLEPPAIGWCIAVFGASAFVAGVFRADPWHGFPAGASEVTTTHGLIHNVAAGVGGLALVVAALLAARSNHRRGRPRWRLDAAAGTGSLVLGAIGSGAGDFRIAFLGGVIGWIWASATLATPTDRLTPA